MLKYFAFVFACLMCMSPKVRAESHWIAAIGQTDLSPHRNRVDGIPSGIETKIMEALAQHTRASLTYVNLPISEARDAFIKGIITIDCCVNKKWFPSKEAQEISDFSIPIFKVHNIFIFSKGRAKNMIKAKDLSLYKVGTIKGFSYLNEEYFGTRVDADNPEALLRLIQNGKVDVGILERHVASYIRDKNNLKVQFGTIFSGLDVSVRVHLSILDDLAKINKAIFDLKNTGKIKQIILESVKP